MSKIMSVGGYNPSKIAVGVSLDADGKVQVNNPKMDKIIGSIVEPHADSYKGLVAVLGAKCIANVSLVDNAYGNPFKDGNTYVLGAANYICILDQNLNIIKFKESNGTGNIVGCYADSKHVFTFKSGIPSRIEKYNKSDLTFVKEVVSAEGDYQSTSWRGVVTLVGDANHIYSIMRGRLVKYNKDLESVASKDLSEVPVSATVSSQFRMLGVHNRKLIFSRWISTTEIQLFSANMDTLEIIEIGSGVSAHSSFIDGDNVVTVSKNGMEITNILTGVMTSHPIGGNFAYSPTNLSGVSNGKYAVVTGDIYPSDNVVEVREVSPKDGYESRVYLIKLDFSILGTHIDDIGRVWVMGNGGIMLLNDELSLKGYRIV